MISDEMLMAYVDGQLAANDRVRVETYLATDPEARSRLQVFVETGPALARALDAATARPVPAWLAAAVLGNTSASAQARTPRVGMQPVGGLSAGGMRAAIGRGVLSFWPVAAGSFAAMLVGVTIGWNLNMTGARAPERDLIISSADGQLRAGTDLSRVLETAESGRAVALSGIDNAASVTPVLSFESGHAGVCRQYRVSLPVGPGPGLGIARADGYEGLACRAADGTWRIDVHTPAEAPRASPDRITPASGPGHSIVDAVVDGLISGEAFSRDEEVRRLRESWKSQRSPGNPSSDQSRGGPATGK